MHNTITQEQRYEMLTRQPVEKVIPRLAVPTIISMLISSIYNTADTFFVSQLGTSASGAVGIIFSAMAIIQAIAFMIGMGSGNYMARCFGAGEQEKGEKIASTGFFTGLIMGTVIMVIGLSNIEQIVMMLGSTETIKPYAVAYARYIFLAAPFMMCSFIMNNLLRLQGLAAYAMLGIASGGILNIFLDPIFIFGLNLGTAGAAIATGLSQFTSFCILLCQCNLRKSCVSIRFCNFAPSFSMYRSIIVGGLPSLGRQGMASLATLLCQCNLRKSCVSIRFCNFAPSFSMYRSIIVGGLPSLGRQGMASLATIILNLTARPYGDAAIAAMAIVSRCTMLLNSTVVGFGQGFQPVCAFSFGAHKYSRVKNAFWFCVKVSTIFLLCVSVIIFLFSGHVIELFRKGDPKVIAIGTLALRLQICTLPLGGYLTLSNMCSQSIGYGFRSTLLAMSRQGFFLIPILLITSSLFGLLGIQIAQPLSDLCTFLLTVFIMRGIFKELNALEQQETGERPAGSFS